MGQFPYVNSPTINQEANNKNVVTTPCELGNLPNGAEVTEVWCGSEFTLAVDDAGLLWACGWNEHFNLGTQDSVVEALVDIDSKSQVALQSHVQTQSTTTTTTISATTSVITTQGIKNHWQPVMMKQRPSSASTFNSTSFEQIKLKIIWEGSLAAGGGHVICYV